MFSLDYLLKSNTTICLYYNIINDGMYTYEFNNNSFGLNDFSQIITFVNFAVKYYNLKLPFCFRLGYITFEDKLSYICLESLCYHIIDKGYKVYIDLFSKYGIGTEGVISTPINLLCVEKNNTKKFLKKFEFEIYGNHYRLLAKRACNKHGELPSKVMNDLKIFLGTFNVEKRYIYEIAEVVSELVDNSLEHASSDCLIDIDVSTNYRKKNDPNGNYYGVNIAIIDIDDKLLGSKIKNFLLTNEDNIWYNKLKEAYKFHKQNWNLYYDEDDFFMLSAFQRNISSRKRDYITGGTGLTTLISTIEKDSDSYNCYAISGNHIIKFDHDSLGFDEDEWVGFNKENDFVSSIPDLSNIQRSNLFYSGTAYNLIFVLKKEEKNEK